MKRFTRDLSLSWPATGRLSARRRVSTSEVSTEEQRRRGERGEQRRHYCCHDHRRCEGLAYAHVEGTGGVNARRGGHVRVGSKNGPAALEMGCLYYPQKQASVTALPIAISSPATVERSSPTSTSPPRSFALTTSEARTNLGANVRKENHLASF
jgi:hypothetical protein